MMLAANVHQGTRNLNAAMKGYVWRRRADGVHIINLEKTWEKMILAARVIVTIENPGDVCVISGRPYGQRAVIKFSQHTGATQLPGRFTPGTFTNQIQKLFLEPRLLILTDPRTDEQPLKESSYVSIPTICFCDTDNELQHVDIAIPANNKGRYSIGLMYWLLAREIRRMRGHLPRVSPWEVSVDLFFYRDPEEIEKQQQEQAERQQQDAGGLIAYDAAGGDTAAAGQAPADDWQAPAVPNAAAGQEWGAPTAVAPTGGPTAGGFADASQQPAQPAQADEWAAPNAAPQQQPPQAFGGGYGYQAQAPTGAPAADDWGAQAPAQAPVQAAPQAAPQAAQAFAAPQQQPW